MGKVRVLQGGNIACAITTKRQFGFPFYNITEPLAGLGIVQNTFDLSRADSLYVDSHIH